jgi:hypothetical protein
LINYKVFIVLVRYFPVLLIIFAFYVYFVFIYFCFLVFPLNVENHRQQVAELLSRAYTTISVHDAGTALGLNTDQAIQGIFLYCTFVFY